MRVVVDTNILVKGIKEHRLDAMAVLMHFYNNRDLMIVQDSSNVVRQEYLNNVGSHELFQNWYKNLEMNSQIEFRSGKLNKKVQEALLKLGFHEPTDQTFVSLALETDRTIITEDSDYGKGKEDKAAANVHVLTYMQEALELQVMDAAEGSDYLTRRE